jgi:hypothetical protein
VPLWKELESAGYVILSGADIAVEDSGQKKLLWEDIKDKCSVTLRVYSRRDIIGKFKSDNVSKIELFYYNEEEKKWESSGEDVELGYNEDYYFSKGYAIGRLAPYVFVYKPDESDFNATGVIYGKILSKDNGIKVSGKSVGLYDSEGNLVSEGITNEKGIAKLSYKVFLNNISEFNIKAYVNGKELQEKLKILKKKSDIDIVTLTTQKTIPCECEAPELKINAGWNLLGWCGETESPSNVVSNNTVKTLWKWDGTGWQLWSPYKSIMNLISNYGLTSIEKIDKGEGFWVNK